MLSEEQRQVVVDNEKYGPFIAECCRVNNEPMLRHLLDEKQSAYRCNFQHLAVAAQSGSLEVVLYLIERMDSDPFESCTPDGDTLFHLAANTAEILDRLLEYIYDVDRLADLCARTNGHGATPLHCSAAANNVEASIILLQCSIKPVELRDDHGRTPAMCTTDPDLQRLLGEVTTIDESEVSLLDNISAPGEFGEVRRAYWGPNIVAAKILKEEAKFEIDRDHALRNEVLIWQYGH